MCVCYALHIVAEKMLTSYRNVYFENEYMTLYSGWSWSWSLSRFEYQMRRETDCPDEEETRPRREDEAVKDIRTTEHCLIDRTSVRAYPIEER
jgi:hypothetical protein